MDAGQLDQQISVQSRTVTQDELGADVENWITTSTPWANVKETPGREFLKGDFQGEEKTVFRIRWRDMDSTARVEWRGKVYTIESVTGTMREGWTWLHCKRISGAN